MQQHSINRILDANLNRAREGLRVVEELARLLLEDAKLQQRIKRLRHGVTQAEKSLGVHLLPSRAAADDPGASRTTPTEARRGSLPGLARANCRRSQEALRVLEELAKLYSDPASRSFKRLRFAAYDIERDLVERLVRK